MNPANPLPRAPRAAATRRRAFLRLGALLALVMLSELVVGLFAAWSLDRLNRQQLSDGRELLVALDEGRSAQAQFKIQVQEWKNFLLRGAEPAARNDLWARVQRREREVDQRLQSLQARLQALGADSQAQATQALRAEHARVGEVYRLQFERVALGPWDPFRTDREVKGVDRELDRGIDELADAIMAVAVASMANAETAARARFEWLNGMLWVAAGLGLLLVGLLVARAIAEPRPAA